MSIEFSEHTQVIEGDESLTRAQLSRKIYENFSGAIKELAKNNDLTQFRNKVEAVETRLKNWVKGSDIKFSEFSEVFRNARDIYDGYIDASMKKEINKLEGSLNDILSRAEVYIPETGSFKEIRSICETSRNEEEFIRQAFKHIYGHETYRPKGNGLYLQGDGISINTGIITDPKVGYSVSNLKKMIGRSYLVSHDKDRPKKLAAMVIYNEIKNNLNKLRDLRKYNEFNQEINRERRFSVSVNGKTVSIDINLVRDLGIKKVSVIDQDKEFLDAKAKILKTISKAQEDIIRDATKDKGPSYLKEFDSKSDRMYMLRISSMLKGRYRKEKLPENFYELLRHLDDNGILDFGNIGTDLTKLELRYNNSVYKGIKSIFRNLPDILYRSRQDKRSAFDQFVKEYKNKGLTGLNESQLKQYDYFMTYLGYAETAKRRLSLVTDSGYDLATTQKFRAKEVFSNKTGIPNSVDISKLALGRGEIPKNIDPTLLRSQFTAFMETSPVYNNLNNYVLLKDGVYRNTFYRVKAVLAHLEKIKDQVDLTGIYRDKFYRSLIKGLKRAYETIDDRHPKDKQRYKSRVYELTSKLCTLFGKEYVDRLRGAEILDKESNDIQKTLFDNLNKELVKIETSFDKEDNGDTVDSFNQVKQRINSILDETRQISPAHTSMYIEKTSKTVSEIANKLGSDMNDKKALEKLYLLAQIKGVKIDKNIQGYISEYFSDKLKSTGGIDSFEFEIFKLHKNAQVSPAIDKIFWDQVETEINNISLETGLQGIYIVLINLEETYPGKLDQIIGSIKSKFINLVDTKDPEDLVKIKEKIYSINPYILSTRIHPNIIINDIEFNKKVVTALLQAVLDVIDSKLNAKISPYKDRINKSFQGSKNKFGLTTNNLKNVLDGEKQPLIDSINDRSIKKLVGVEYERMAKEYLTGKINIRFASINDFKGLLGYLDNGQLTTIKTNLESLGVYERFQGSVLGKFKVLPIDIDSIKISLIKLRSLNDTDLNTRIKEVLIDRLKGKVKVAPNIECLNKIKELDTVLPQDTIKDILKSFYTNRIETKDIKTLLKSDSVFTKYCNSITGVDTNLQDTLLKKIYKEVDVSNLYILKDLLGNYKKGSKLFIYPRISEYVFGKDQTKENIQVYKKIDKFPDFKSILAIKCKINSTQVSIKDKKISEILVILKTKNSGLKPDQIKLIKQFISISEGVFKVSRNKARFEDQTVDNLYKIYNRYLGLQNSIDEKSPVKLANNVLSYLKDQYIYQIKVADGIKIENNMIVVNDLGIDIKRINNAVLIKFLGFYSKTRGLREKVGGFEKLLLLGMPLDDIGNCIKFLRTRLGVSIKRELGGDTGPYEFIINGDNIEFYRRADKKKTYKNIVYIDKEFNLKVNEGARDTDVPGGYKIKGPRNTIKSLLDTLDTSNLKLISEINKLTVDQILKQTYLTNILSNINNIQAKDQKESLKQVLSNKIKSLVSKLVEDNIATIKGGGADGSKPYDDCFDVLVKEEETPGWIKKLVKDTVRKKLKIDQKLQSIDISDLDTTNTNTKAQTISETLNLFLSFSKTLHWHPVYLDEAIEKIRTGLIGLVKKNKKTEATKFLRSLKLSCNDSSFQDKMRSLGRAIKQAIRDKKIEAVTFDSIEEILKDYREITEPKEINKLKEVLGRKLKEVYGSNPGDPAQFIKIYKLLPASLKTYIDTEINNTEYFKQADRYLKDIRFNDEYPDSQTKFQKIRVYDLGLPGKKRLVEKFLVKYLDYLVISVQSCFDNNRLRKLKTLETLIEQKLIRKEEKDPYISRQLQVFKTGFNRFEKELDSRTRNVFANTKGLEALKESFGVHQKGEISIKDQNTFVSIRDRLSYIDRRYPGNARFVYEMDARMISRLGTIKGMSLADKYEYLFNRKSVYENEKSLESMKNLILNNLKSINKKISVLNKETIRTVDEFKSIVLLYRKDTNQEVKATLKTKIIGYINGIENIDQFLGISKLGLYRFFKEDIDSKLETFIEGMEDEIEEASEGQMYLLSKKIAKLYKVLGIGEIPADTVTRLKEYPQAVKKELEFWGSLNKFDKLNENGKKEKLEDIIKYLEANIDGINGLEVNQDPNILKNILEASFRYDSEYYNKVIKILSRYKDLSRLEDHFRKVIGLMDNSSAITLREPGSVKRFFMSELELNIIIKKLPGLKEMLLKRIDIFSDPKFRFDYKSVLWYLDFLNKYEIQLTDQQLKYLNKKLKKNYLMRKDRNNQYYKIYSKIELGKGSYKLAYKEFDRYEGIDVYKYRSMIETKEMLGYHDISSQIKHDKLLVDLVGRVIHYDITGGYKDSSEFMRDFIKNRLDNIGIEKVRYGYSKDAKTSVIRINDRSYTLSLDDNQELLISGIPLKKEGDRFYIQKDRLCRVEIKDGRLIPEWLVNGVMERADYDIQSNIKSFFEKMDNLGKDNAVLNSFLPKNIRVYVSAGKLVAMFNRNPGDIFEVELESKDMVIKGDKKKLAKIFKGLKIITVGLANEGYTVGLSQFNTSRKEPDVKKEPKASKEVEEEDDDESDDDESDDDGSDDDEEDDDEEDDDDEEED